MSPPASTELRPGLYTPKPRADIYTVLLSIALVALIVACVCLYLEASLYEWTTNAPRAAVTPNVLQSSIGQIVQC